MTYVLQWNPRGGVPEPPRTHREERSDVFHDSARRPADGPDGTRRKDRAPQRPALTELEGRTLLSASVDAVIAQQGSAHPQLLAGPPPEHRHTRARTPARTPGCCRTSDACRSSRPPTRRASTACTGRPLPGAGRVRARRSGHSVTGRNAVQINRAPESRRIPSTSAASTGLRLVQQLRRAATFVAPVPATRCIRSPRRAFVDGLYQDVLGRPADSERRGVLDEQPPAGSQLQLRDPGLLNSAEYQGCQLTGGTPATDTAARHHHRRLRHRAAIRANWHRRRERRTRLYQTVRDRNPTQAGVNNGLTSLSQGTSLGGLRNQLTNSPEATKLLQRARHQRQLHRQPAAAQTSCTGALPDTSISSNRPEHAVWRYWHRNRHWHRRRAPEPALHRNFPGPRRDTGTFQPTHRDGHEPGTNPGTSPGTQPPARQPGTTTRHQPRYDTGGHQSPVRTTGTNPRHQPPVPTPGTNHRYDDRHQSGHRPRHESGHQSGHQQRRHEPPVNTFGSARRT